MEDNEERFRLSAADSLEPATADWGTGESFWANTYVCVFPKVGGHPSLIRL